MKNLRLGGLSSIAVAVVIAPQAYAIENTNQVSSSVGNDEIIVTARRVSESLQSTPVAVTAATGELLTSAQVNTIDQLPTLAPGLIVAPSQAQPGSANFTLRGQSSPDALIAIDQAIGVYVDGIYVARSSGGLLNFVDIERVEVLRGPQGTLFGRNTTGGAVNIISRRPSDEFEAMLRVGAGNYKARELTAVVNAPLSQALGARFVYQHSERDGYGKDGSFGGRIGGDNAEFVRGIIAYDNGGPFRGDVQFDFSDRRTGGEVIGLKSFTSTPQNEALIALCSGPAASASCPVALPAGASLADYAWDSPTREHDDFYRIFPSMDGIYGNAETWGVSTTLEYDLSDVLTVKSISAWRGVDTESLTDNDGSPLAMTGGLTAREGNFIHQRQFSQELQLSGQALDDNLTYIFGGFYFVENGRDLSRSFSLFPLNPALSLTDATVRNESQAAYGQFTYKIAEPLRFTGGVRYTKDIRSIIRRNASEPQPHSGNLICGMDPSTLDAPGVCEASNRRTFDYWSYTAGLDWQVDDGIFLYAKTSKANRAGGFNTRAITGGGISFDPEAVTDYEIGGKFDFLGRRVRLNLALFQSDYKNIQRNVPFVSPNGVLASGNQNIAEGRIRGLEAELSLRPFEGLRLSGALTLLDAKYTDFSIPVIVDGDVTSVDVTSTPFVYTPKTAYTLSADYSLPTSFGELNIRGDYAYRSTTYGLGPFVGEGLFGATTPNTNRISGYGVFNGRLAAQFNNPNLEIALFARNLTNKKYIQRILVVQDTALGISSYVPGSPRTYGLNLTYKFGGY